MPRGAIDASFIARVEILLRAVELHFAGDDAAEPVGDGGDTGGVLAGIADDGHVAFQLLFALFEEAIEVVAADFFLAFDDKLHVDGELLLRLEPGFDGLDVGEHLAFVVRRAAGVDLAVADLRLEGGRFPFVERIGRLDVVVAIDECGGRAGCVEPLAVHDRIALRFDELGLHPGA